MMKKGNSKNSPGTNDIDISRRKAMKKMGLIAFSSATMLLLLNQPGKSQTNETSDGTDPGDPGNF